MAFYRIKDAATKVGVLPHVLRFWEAQFPMMKPQKTSRGQRLYNDEDIENFMKIKHLLYAEGYSISGAKKVLKGKWGERADLQNQVGDILSKELLEETLVEIKRLENAVKEL